MREVRDGADLTVRIAGDEGPLAAFVLDVEIPALLRDEDLEALSGQLDFARDELALKSLVVDIPIKSRKWDTSR